MSRQQQTSSSSYTSYSYSSSSSSNTRDGEHVSGHREMQTSYTDPSGQTTVQRASQNLGEPIVREERQFDSQGRELLGDGSNGGSAGRRIEDVSDEEQRERDRRYEEAMEDEYAKREGGA